MTEEIQNKPKKLRKSKKSETKIVTSFDNSAPYVPEDLSSAVTLTNMMKKSLGVVEGPYEKEKTVFVSRQSGSSTVHSVDERGARRLSDNEQRDISILDPYISAIISTRVAQTIPLGRLSESRFDKGCRIIDKNPPKKEDFEDKKQFKAAQNVRKKQAEMLMEWVLNCGTTDKEIVDYVFKDSNRDFKVCRLHQFIAAQTRNLLTFGRCGTHVMRDRAGNPIMFRPVPIEEFFRVKQSLDISISYNEDVQEQSIEDAKAYNLMDKDERPTVWVQRKIQNIVAVYDETELKVWNYQDQALAELNGYPLSPIEQAVFMIYIHQQTLQYMRNAFTKGMAAKGMLVLSSTNETSSLSQEDVDQFRNEFHNFVTRNDNSATVPVIGGSITAQWVQLSATPNDMQFLELEEHVIRAICSAFQIAPQELLQSSIGQTAQGGISDGGKETELIASQERGLRVLLDVIFDGLNEILSDNFPSLSKNFELVHTGIGSDTKDAITQQSIAELQTTATMGSLWGMSEKPDSFAFGSDVPLAAAFWAGPGRMMKLSEIRYYFFGEEDALKKPEFDFFIDPTINQSYLQAKTMPPDLQKQSNVMQIQAQADQIQQQKAEGEQQAQMEQKAAEQGQQQSPVAQNEQAAQDSGQKPVSAKQDYANRMKQVGMQKSMRSYFKDWIDVNTED